LRSSRGEEGAGRLFWLVGVAIAGALAGYLVTRLEGEPPRVEVLPGSIYVGAQADIDVRAFDAGTGLEHLRVWLVQNGKETPIAEEHYPGDLFRGATFDFEQKLGFQLNPKELGLADGALVVRAEARDYSWRGNRSSAEVSLRIDSVPPHVTVATGLTYVRQGGAELAVYSVGEPIKHHGVEVGERFFPGYPHPADPDQLIAFYALGTGTANGVHPQVVAIDRAGNRTSVPLALSVVEQEFASDRVNLSDAFMERKVKELMPEHEGDLLEGYLRVNRDLRRANEEQIARLCATSSPNPLWSGPFLQLPGSQVNARFGERRTYFYQDQPVDKQLHLGFDLASTARATVPAANDGVVVFAGPLGLYGNTVIVDHGLGIFTLYGHLSEIAVEKGHAIARGGALGRTGDTGLAGGDHLHYSVLVSGVSVDPLEWFDSRWLREHVDVKLAEAEPSPS
jgi:murein DD-endopeptidase MepM/ murein hydrolase activator NlpD